MNEMAVTLAAVDDQMSETNIECVLITWGVLIERCDYDNMYNFFSILSFFFSFLYCYHLVYQTC